MVIGRYADDLENPASDVEEDYMDEIYEDDEISYWIVSSYFPFVRLIKSRYGIFAVPKALYDLIQGGAHHRRLILAEV